MKNITSKFLSLLFTVSLITGMVAIPVSADSNGITLSGTCHVQDYGDTAGKWDESTGILTLGTRGQSTRVEAITINLENNTGYGGSLQYRVHVQDIGWQDYRNAGEMAGTSGLSKRLEGIEMELTGELAAYYTVEYAVHIQDYGDAQGFVSDGALAGTTGESKRLEEVQVRIVPRGIGTSMSVNYRVHRQDYGWESSWAKDGAESGTVGESKRLEGIEIHLTGNQYAGSIKYHTHVQNIGWESTWSKDGEMSGTQGLSYRLEGIEIKLTGDISNYYDVYYRVHAQDYGWLGWAKNGEMSGTSGLSKRLEAIQIVLVAKGGDAPGNVAGVSSVMVWPAVTSDGPMEPSATQPSSTPAPSSGSGTTTPSKVTEPSPTNPTYSIPDYKVNPYYLPEAECIGQLWTFDGYIDSNIVYEQEFVHKTFLFPLSTTETEVEDYAAEWFGCRRLCARHYGRSGYLYSDGTIRNFPTGSGGAIGSWLSDDGKYRISRSGKVTPVTWTAEDVYLDQDYNLVYKRPVT